MTQRFTSEPPDAANIIGMRIASEWNAPQKIFNPETAAKEPIPIISRSPLIAITAVQALWRRTNRKLTKAMTQDRTQLLCSLDLSIGATIFTIAFLRRCSVELYT